MADLPTGTVTLLLSDVEGSTRLWELAPAAMGEAMAHHDALVEEHVAANSGQLVRPRGEGDSRFAVFVRAREATAAARDLQQALAAETWPTPGPLRVRMALHTGEVELRAGDYYGSEVNRCARLRALAHGGQTLLSQATFDLVRDALPQGVTVTDLGEHRLKDLQRPEHIYQLDVVGLSAAFPPLQSVDVFPNNLPVQLTSFVGREIELAEVRELLARTHLLTLTGPGGTGKTRLSLQLAAEVLEGFIDGVWLVELAPLADPNLLPQAVAAALNVREQPPRSITDALTDYLRGKSVLLILDNCEHLIDACAQLANTLLRAAPGLKILASSREALGIAGETAYRVPSLPLPDLQAAGLDALAQNDSVRLFVDRAQAASPSFHLTEKNAPAVVEVCRRLDGIPLAIELAAARVAIFSPEEIALRLDDRFRLLTGGSRAAMERHQTLRALIDWSYDLLSVEERTLFRQLSVFGGGWAFEAAQVIGTELDVLKLMTQLVNKSLVMAEEQAQGTRYRLPETIRQYARDKLFESGEAGRARDRHLDFYLHFAETAEPKLRGADQLDWLAREETEHDNLRIALAWSLESGKGDRALDLVGALFYFWHLRGYWSESIRWGEDALALADREQRRLGSVEESRADMARRAKLLSALAWVRLTTFDIKPAHKALEESLRLWRELGDKWWTAVTLATAGLVSQVEGDLQMALARREEGVALAREVDDPWVLASCLIRLGDTLRGTDAAAARHVLEEGVPLARRVGDRRILSEGLIYLGGLYSAEGNLTAAAALGGEALVEARRIGSLIHIFLALWQLVAISCLQNDLAKAREYALELLAFARNTGSPLGFLFALWAFALAACFGGQVRRGVLLFVAVESALGQRGIKPPEGDPNFVVVRQALESAQAQLGPAAFEAAMAEGRALTLEQALALATED